MMKMLIMVSILLAVNSCKRGNPMQWDGPMLTQPRTLLTVDQLVGDSTLPLVDMSFFSKPDWALTASHNFSGSVSFADTEMLFPKKRDPYDGENIFPGITIDFISNEGELIPIQKEKIATGHQSKSLWDVILGTGRIWREAGDGEWGRASFPLTLTDRYIGQARNCVGTFVYQPDTVSNICIQCSQETADFNDGQVGDIRVMLKAKYEPKSFSDSAMVVERHEKFKSRRLQVIPLASIDTRNEVADYFEKQLYTNAPTSLGAILIDDQVYLHPPKTRHGLYPYPDEMRHGLYSVTKSMAGALSLLYFAERYSEDIFDELITDHVPALADHRGWQGVTFSHTLNMVTGTVGSESSEHLLNILVLPRTAEESIYKIASLGDSPEAPGEKFNYASTNLFVLSYALQNYVEEKEGKGIHYWDMVHENVLVPIGAPYFSLLHTVETDGTKGIPRLAYGALPTLDEAAKISLLFSNEGSYNRQQLLHREKTLEALGRSKWSGYSTNNDDRGMAYRHSFWSTTIATDECTVNVNYMLGYGGNDILFLPGNVVVLRFMDEYDLDFSELVRGVGRVAPICTHE